MGHMTAKVAVAKAIYAIDRPYDYRVPQELEGRLRPGMRVLVPFGAGNRGSDGIVLALNRETCRAYETETLAVEQSAAEAMLKEQKV